MFAMGEWRGHIGQFTLKECVWSKYKIQLEQFLEYMASKLTDYTDEWKARFVLSVLSSECYNVLSAVCVPEKLSYASLIELCDAHFQPRDNVFHARYKFYNAHREPNQSLRRWAQRVRCLAAGCALRGEINAELRDRFITGLSEGPLLDRLFEEDDELSFEEAVEIAVGYDEMGGNKKKNAKKREKQLARSQKETTDSVPATPTGSMQMMRVQSFVEPVTEDLTLPDVSKNDVEVNKEKSGNKHERKFGKMGRNHSFSTDTTDFLDTRSESVPAQPMETSQVATEMTIQEDCSRGVEPQETTMDNSDENFYESSSCFNATATEVRIPKYEQNERNISLATISTKEESTEDVDANRKGNKSYAQTTGENPTKNPDSKRREINYGSSNDLSRSSSSSQSSQYNRNRDGQHDMGNSWGQKPNFNSKSSSGNWRESDWSKNKDSSKFEPLTMKNSNTIFIKVEEIDGDLFSMPLEYSLGHCVAEDMNMGSGIAVGFRQTFKRIDELLQQRAKQGGLAVLDDKGRFIYYLVTKIVSSGKPTYETLEKSLQKMKEHIVTNNVKKLALPRLGCGLDRLEWSRVKEMLESVFSTVDIKITVCNFQQTLDAPPPTKSRKCHVVNVSYPIEKIGKMSIIIYLGSEDHYVTEEIQRLDEKFGILRPYRSSTEKSGQIIRTEVSRGDYVLYGCIVRKKIKDPFVYTDFQKCLGAIQRNNSKDLYEYVGIQVLNDVEDGLFMDKIVNLIRNTLTHVDVYVCGQPEWKCNDKY